MAEHTIIRQNRWESRNKTNSDLFLISFQTGKLKDIIKAVCAESTVTQSSRGEIACSDKEPSSRHFLPLRCWDAVTTQTTETGAEIASPNEDSSLVVYFITSSSASPLHSSERTRTACHAFWWNSYLGITSASEGWQCSTVEVSAGRQAFVAAGGVLLHR